MTYINRGLGAVVVFTLVAGCGTGESAQPPPLSPVTNRQALTAGFTGSLPASGSTPLLRSLSDGGVVASFWASTATYSSTSNTWTAGPAPLLLEFSCAAALPASKVLRSGASGTDVYDPLAGSWSMTGSLVFSATNYTCIDLADGTVLMTSNGTSGPKAQWFSPRTSSWFYLGAPPQTGPGVRLLDGRVLLTESWPAVFNSTSSTFTSVGTSADGRYEGTTVRLLDGRVLMMGGSGANAPTASLFDPTTNTFSAAAPLLTPRMRAAAVLLSTGKVLLAGGSSADGTNSLSSVELYDPATNTWSAGTPLLLARERHSMIVLQEGSVLAVGGSNVVSGVSQTLGGANGAEILQPGCLPLTCAGAGRTCGSLADGCGSTLDCGSCSSGMTCNQGSCCTPTTCAAAGKNCGSISDGCGALLDCGSCAAGQGCSNNVCGSCVPTNCAALNDNCGTVDDGCGGPLSCGTCYASEVCVANQCAPSVDQPAFYDSTLQAPRCSTPGRGCTSGTLLIRNGTMEFNGPNTINQSCFDGASGASSGHSVESLRVTTVDGGILSTGTTVRVEANVIAWGNGADFLDLYSTATAATPAWTLLSTLTPAAGASMRSATFKLPAGALQAVRAHIRMLGGSATPCNGSSYPYDDRDDLVFSVAADSRPPSVSITSPAAGASLKGYVLLNVAASDNDRVASVTYFDGTTSLGTATTSPFSIFYITTSFAGGAHTLTARAVDAAGNATTSAPVTVQLDNTAPTTAVTSPTEASALHGAVTVTASASDNSGVTRVDLFDGASLVGSATTSPYSFVWNTGLVADGAHALHTTAYDAAGNSASSPARNVTVDNTAPSTTLTAPADGAFVRGVVAVVGVASDVGLALVELLVDGVPVGSSATSPVGASWDTTFVADGAHVLQARASDVVGNSTVSAPVAVSVDNTAPTTDFASPLEGATVHGAVILDATATDNLGVARVDFFDGSTWVGAATAAPWEVTWDSLSAGEGPHALHCVASDAAGNATASVARNLVVDNAPTVSVTAPVQGALVAGVVTLSASAQALDGRTVASVDFLVDGALVGSATLSPFALAWNSMLSADGAHAVVARAHDSVGYMADSAAVAFSLDNTAPTTALTSPSAGAVLGQAVVTVSATASDNVAVASVEFYDGSTLIGSVASAPYSVSWNTVGLSGVRVLTARAFDTAGHSTTSAGVSVTVLTGQTATYFTTLKAPRCGTLGVSCDSGTLLVGRGKVGPEVNKPNTIGASCTDGTSGSFHASESLDALNVTSVGGGPLVPGTQVRVKATVWATQSADRLDVWTAANANSPSWVLVGTLTPTVFNAASTLSTTFTLPNGALQAVRGSFRRNGSATTCPSGSYNDRDDLIFVTQ